MAISKVVTLPSGKTATLEHVKVFELMKESKHLLGTASAAFLTQYSYVEDWQVQMGLTKYHAEEMSHCSTFTLKVELTANKRDTHYKEMTRVIKNLMEALVEDMEIRCELSQRWSGSSDQDHKLYELKANFNFKHSMQEIDGAFRLVGQAAEKLKELKAEASLPEIQLRLSFLP
jgi:hypothetical protein